MLLLHETLSFDQDSKVAYRVNAVEPVLSTFEKLETMGEGSKIIFLTPRCASLTLCDMSVPVSVRMAMAARNMAAVSMAVDFKERGIIVGIFEEIRTDLIDELDLANSGKFFGKDGEVIPW